MTDKYPDSVSLQLGDAEFTVLVFKSTVHIGQDDGKAFHCHSHYELHYNPGPKGLVTFDTGTQAVETEDLLLIGPDMLHLGVPMSTKVLAFALTRIQGEKGFYDRFCRGLEKTSLQVIPASAKFRQLMAQYESTEKDGSFRSYCNMKLLVTELLMELFVLWGFFREESDFGTLQPVSTAAFYATLDSLAFGDASLRRIAEELGYSVRQTSRIIAMRYGMSLSRLRRQVIPEEWKD